MLKLEVIFVRKRILFGAGVYARKYAALLEYLQMDFDYFADNDPTKWGKTLFGKEIISPSRLAEFEDCEIIISCSDKVAIRQQLYQMNLITAVRDTKEMYHLLEKKMQQDHLASHRGVCTIPEKRRGEPTIIVDMYEGLGWSGTDQWAVNLSYQLNQHGKKAYLLGRIGQTPLDEKYEQYMHRMEDKETILSIVNWYEENLPITVINNYAGSAYLAAVITKLNHPGQVKIVSVIHNDIQSLFDAHMLLSEYLDSVFCVSNEICRKMKRLYAFDEKKYFFKEQPIPVAINFEKDEKPLLRIGYAGRLACQQKRADLLPDLINELENAQINYTLQIAGDGECKYMLEKYVHQKNLQEKIQLLGRIPKEKMEGFWMNQNVFINISEFEGTSLSMLEAMAYGCVPVVTDVSGAREFITKGENGYICEIGNFSEMAHCIKELDQRRDKLRKYGQESRKRIIERCNPESYIQFWITSIV